MINLSALGIKKVWWMVVMVKMKFCLYVLFSMPITPRFWEKNCSISIIWSQNSHVSYYSFTRSLWIPLDCETYVARVYQFWEVSVEHEQNFFFFIILENHSCYKRFCGINMPEWCYDLFFISLVYPLSFSDSGYDFVRAHWQV